MTCLLPFLISADKFIPGISRIASLSTSMAFVLNKKAAGKMVPRSSSLTASALMFAHHQLNRNTVT